jgi:UDP-N-acetylmuramoyl-tripeptide--D-alanyl-D-alanine ligase
VVPGLALQEVLPASGGALWGALDPDSRFSRVMDDPGRVRPGDLFVAAPGERIDGHDVVAVAAWRGATAAVVTREWASRLEELPLPLIVVDDAPISALQRIAAARRRRLTATVVGITGSVGKTTTKEAVGSVLERRFRTYRTVGNRNSDIGMPLTLLEADVDAEVVVLELGAIAAGDVALLAAIAKPRVGVVTNVHPVHLARIGSLEAIAETKAGLVEALPPEGTAILNGDDARVRAMASRCAGPVMTYGRSEGNDVRAGEVVLQGIEGCSFSLVLPAEQAQVRVPLPGTHAVETALASACVAVALGMTMAEIVPALEQLRIQIRLRSRSGPDGSVLLDDSYNASPPSVRSALDLLAESDSQRRVAVLGDMLELGQLSEQEHRTVGRQVAQAADLLVTYGELAEVIADEAARHSDAMAIRSFAGRERSGLLSFLRTELRRGDVVLIKGSRGLRMDRIADALAEDR